MNEPKEPESELKIEADVIFDLKAIGKMSDEEFARLSREGKLPLKQDTETPEPPAT